MNNARSGLEALPSRGLRTAEEPYWPDPTGSGVHQWPAFAVPKCPHPAASGPRNPGPSSQPARDTERRCCFGSRRPASMTALTNASWSGLVARVRVRQTLGRILSKVRRGHIYSSQKTISTNTGTGMLHIRCDRRIIFRVLIISQWATGLSRASYIVPPLSDTKDWDAQDAVVGQVENDGSSLPRRAVCSIKTS